MLSSAACFRSSVTRRADHQFDLLRRLLLDSLEMPFHFTAQTFAFSGRFGASRLAQTLDLAVQIRQTLVDAGRAGHGILLGFGGLEQRLLNLLGALREVRRRVFGDQVA